MNVITMNCVFTNSSYIIILPVPNFQDTYNILQPQRVHMLYVPCIYIYICHLRESIWFLRSRFGHTLFFWCWKLTQDIKLSSLPRPSFLPPEFWEVWSLSSRQTGVFSVGSLKRSTWCELHSYPRCFWSQRTLVQTYGEWLLICLFQVEMERINSTWLTPKKELAAVASPEGFVWCCKIQGVCSTRSPAVERTY